MIAREDGTLVVTCDSCGERIWSSGSMCTRPGLEVAAHETVGDADMLHFCPDCSSPANQEFRICGTCGRPMVDGFTVEDGGWYCCSRCLAKTLDRDYPDGWRQNGHDGDRYWCGGYYDFRDEDGEWRDSGIFYTEWY